MLLFGKPGTFWLMSPFPMTSDAAAASCCRFLLCGAGEVMLSSRQQQSLLTAVAQRYAVAEPVSRLVDVSYLSNASLRELCVQAVQEGLDSPTNSCSASFALLCSVVVSAAVTCAPDVKLSALRWSVRYC